MITHPPHQLRVQLNAAGHGEVWLDGHPVRVSRLSIERDWQEGTHRVTLTLPLVEVDLDDQAVTNLQFRAPVRTLKVPMNADSEQGGA